MKILNETITPGFFFDCVVNEHNSIYSRFNSCKKVLDFLPFKGLKSYNLVEYRHINDF